MSERGTLSLSMPKSACSSAVIARRRSARRRRPAACRGCRASSSNQSATSSRSTDGREGTEALAILDLQIERALHRRASARSARIERLPSARGPNSMRPWNQPTALPSASACAVRSMSSARRRRLVETCAGRRQPLLDLVCRRRRARDRRPDMPSSVVRAGARWPQFEMIGRERRAERAAGIARRRLHPDLARTCRRAGPCRWRRN